MIHIAILNKSWGLIPKILDGRKTIESRWYQIKTAPWNRLLVGERVFFKNSGEPITASATISKVLQFEDLDKSKVEEILKMYGKEIGLSNLTYTDYYLKKRYCILIFLKDIVKLDSPFNIDKKGLGISSAWLCLKDEKHLESIKRNC